MSSHKKADHTKGDDKWAGAKVILSLNYELWGSSHVLEMLDIIKTVAKIVDRPKIGLK